MKPGKMSKSLKHAHCVPFFVNYVCIVNSGCNQEHIALNFLISSFVSKRIKAVLQKFCVFKLKAQSLNFPMESIFTFLGPTSRLAK